MRQDKIQEAKQDNEKQIDYQQECWRVWYQVGMTILTLIPMATATLLGKRLGHYAAGAWIPDGLHADTNAMAALLAIDPEAVRRMAARHNVPRTKPGDALVFRATDFLTTHVSPTDVETVPTGCLDNPDNSATRKKPSK